MAVRIPVYERHVQLDSGAQTIPRFQASTELGKAAKEVGNSMIHVAAHWQAKQDSFDKMQMGQNAGNYHAQVNAIIQEETARFAPGVDRPGELHDRIMARVAVANQQFQAMAPPSLARDYKIRGDSTQDQASFTSAGHESKLRSNYGEEYLDKQVAEISASAAKNPDSHPAAIAQVKQAIKDAAAASGFTPQKQQQLEGTYLDTVGKNVVKGYMSQGRAQDAAVFKDQFVKDREAESPVQFQQPIPVQPRTQLPGGSPPPASATGQSGDNSKLNEKRIAQIDAMPEVKAAIEKAAAANGLDPNQLKVFASIESSGNPKDVTGSYHGLFNLSKAEFGMFGGGNIYSAEDNANAAAALLASKKDQLTQTLGREPTATELYGSHQQGLGGIAAHIQNPDQPAWQSMLGTKEGQDRIKEHGQAAAEDWAKKAISGNVPGDVTKRLYGGDASQITSRDFMAIQGTRVQGGNIDEAITNARMQPAPQAPRTVTASADGTVVSDTRPPAYMGGMSVGGQQAPTIAGYQRAGSFPLTEAGAHGYERGGVKTEAWLVDTVRNASKVLPEGYHAEIISTVDPRATGTVWHPTGRAIDIQIYDDKGKKVPNVGGPNVPGWDVYEKMGAAARSYAQDKYPDQHLTWGGHFNTGTAYDRMHFQSGGNHARDFTPDQVAQAGEALKASPVQVAAADDGTGRPAVPQALSRWQQWGTTQQNVIDGGTMKAAAQNQAFKKSLDGRIDADLASTRINGQGIKLPPDLQKYYGTDQLSFDLISNRLGTGRAIQWQQDKDFAQKVYNGGAHMEEMPRSGILERLQAIKPDNTSPYYLDQVKVFNEVLKKAQKIEVERNKDPAGYVDKTYPIVAQKLADSLKDPKNPEKTQALITARMSAQEHLGIPDSLRTPLSVDDAKLLAQPLLDRARPDQASAATEVAQSVAKTVGKMSAEGVPDLAHRALQTVLKTKGINNEQAAATANALVTAQLPPPAPLMPNQDKPTSRFVSDFMSKEGYYQTEGAPYLTPSPGPQNFSVQDNPFVEFQPGTRFVSAEQIAALRKDPTLANIFDNGDGGDFPGYGAGAAKHFLGGGVNVRGSGSEAAAPPSDVLSGPPPEPSTPLAPQPDILTAPEEDQLNTPDSGEQ